MSCDNFVMISFISVMAVFLFLPAYADNSEGWTKGSDLPEPRSEIEAVSIGNKIYIPGGLDNNGNPTDTLFIYDTVKDSWKRGTPMLRELHHASVATDGEKVFVAGGYKQGWIPEDSLLIYNPKSDSWSFGKSMPTARGALTSEFVSGKLYVIGGYSTKTETLVEEYNPITDSWNQKNSMPTPREHLTSSKLNENLHVIGGRSTQGNVGVHEVYNPSNDSWTTLESLPTPRSGLTSVIGEVIVVVGGESRTKTFNENEVFITDNGWVSQEPMKFARHGLASAAVNDRMYVIGGGTAPGFSFSKINEIYYNTSIPEFGYTVFVILIISFTIVILSTRSRIVGSFR